MLAGLLGVGFTVVAGYGWCGCLSVMNAAVVDGSVSHGSASVFVAR